MSDGPEPQIWFQLDRGDQEPLQLHLHPALGRAGAASVPMDEWPLASEEARRAVWERLRAIPGLDLEPRLNGLPKLPITSLADEGPLELFVQVLDYIVDETLRPTAGPREVRAPDQEDVAGSA